MNNCTCNIALHIHLGKSNSQQHRNIDRIKIEQSNQNSHSKETVKLRDDNPTKTFFLIIKLLSKIQNIITANSNKDITSVVKTDYLFILPGENDIEKNVTIEIEHATITRPLF